MLRVKMVTVKLMTNDADVDKQCWQCMITMLMISCAKVPATYD